jgi:hypothetical protein
MVCQILEKAGVALITFFTSNFFLMSEFLHCRVESLVPAAYFAYAGYLSGSFFCGILASAVLGVESIKVEHLDRRSMYASAFR